MGASSGSVTQPSARDSPLVLQAEKASKPKATAAKATVGSARWDVLCPGRKRRPNPTPDPPCSHSRCDPARRKGVEAESYRREGDSQIRPGRALPRPQTATQPHPPIPSAHTRVATLPAEKASKPKATAAKATGGSDRWDVLCPGRKRRPNPTADPPCSHSRRDPARRKGVEAESYRREGDSQIRPMGRALPRPQTAAQPHRRSPLLTLALRPCTPKRRRSRKPSPQVRRPADRPGLPAPPVATTRPSRSHE